MNPKSRIFVQVAFARAATSNTTEALQFASARWGNTSAAASAIRAAVSGVEVGDFDPIADAAIAFIEEVEPLTALGKLTGLRRVPANAPFASTADAAIAYWTAAGRATPVSRAAFETDRLAPLRASALIVVSKELLRHPSAQAEALVRRDLVRALVKLTDSTFLDPANAGIADEMPASITNGVTPISSTGTLAGDIAAAVEAFAGDWQTAAWCLSPSLAATIALQGNGQGLAADLGVRGGAILGVPAFTTAGLPPDSDGQTLVLVDAAGIAYTDDGVELSKAEHASVEMSTAPTGSTVEVAGASQTIVSLFQSHCTSIRASRRINWSAARAPVVISGCNYAGS